MGRRCLDIGESLVCLVAVGQTADIILLESCLERVVILIVAHLSRLALEHVRLCSSVNLNLYSNLLVVVTINDADSNDIVTHALLSSYRNDERLLLHVLLDCADGHVAVLACSNTLELVSLSSSLAQIVSHIDIIRLTSVHSDIVCQCRELHAVVLLAINLKLPDAEDAVDVRNELHVACTHRSDVVGLDALFLAVVGINNCCPMLFILGEENLVRVDLVYA